MSLLAESLVEEWLNGAGYFTIRGARFGVSATDLLAVRPGSSGLEARHIDVLHDSVDAWVKKKFHSPGKTGARNKPWRG